MADRWYYAWSQERLGPYSTAELQELEARGKIQPTDTIWKEGVEQGVQASSVAGLFEGLQSQALTNDVRLPGASVPTKRVLPQTSEMLVPSALDNLGTGVEAGPGTTEPAPAPIKTKVSVLTGATILSQDGEIVRFRKKCIRCGQEDNIKTEARITPGLIRHQFYCSKCRKQAEVLLKCT